MVTVKNILNEEERILRMKKDGVIECWLNCKVRRFVTFFFVKYNKNDGVNKDEMGRVCRLNEEKGNACKVLAGNSERKRSM
jgi:hypothetical protein